MKILLTGGTGNVGRNTVTRLVGNGHTVRVIGRRSGVTIEGAEYVVCDVTDYATLRDQVRGMEGIIHLAAIPWPGGAPAQDIFDINCRGTFNIYQAAAQEGIAKVSCASSINALGFNYGTVPFEIQYFPIDEAHPTCTTDPYSFSKQVMEDIGNYYWRREGISSVSLRLPGVYEVGGRRMTHMAQFAARFRQAIDELLAQPETQRRERVRRAIAKYDAIRPQFSQPISREEMIARFRASRNDPDLLLLRGGFGRSDFWASVDARDAAQALEKGLLTDYEGSHPLFVNNSENAAGIASETLAQLFYPEVTARKRPLQGTDTLVSIDKAREVLGFEPEYPISQLFESDGGGQGIP
jgi:nucleoside-diphosphate-sugar epimerase